MPNRDAAVLLDLLRFAKRLAKLGEGLTFQDLVENEDRLEPVILNLLRLGEAVKRLSPEFRGQHPEIPWADMAGQRDRLIHRYEEIGFQQVCDSTVIHAPRLVPLLEAILAELEAQ